MHDQAELSELDNGQLLARAASSVRSDDMELAHAMLMELDDREITETEQLYALADLANSLDEHSIEIDSYNSLLALHPDNAVYTASLGSAQLNANLTEEGVATLSRALEINPATHFAHYCLGEHLYFTGQYDDALEHLLEAVNLKSKNPEPYAALVSVLSKLGRYEEALKYADKMVNLKPRALQYNVLARLHTEMGDFQRAEQSIRKAIKADKHFGASYLGLSFTKKYSEGDRKTVAAIEKVLESDLTLLDRSNICFALGKIYDDLGEWDRAFSYYEQANRLRKPVNPPESHASYHKQQVRKHYNKQTVRGMARAVDTSRVPVFIVGMPRSGTTLLEQILSSHPQIEAAGELMDIDRIADELLPHDGSRPPGGSPGFDPEQLDKHSQRYLEALTRGREGAQRVVDKMPDNYRHLGLIHMLFPEATVIHAVRNPLDLCLSCFMQPFENVEMSYSLEWIAQAYRTYRDIMAYWDKVLVSNRLFHFRYEDIVSDPESKIRELVEATGLGWDSACLDFTSNSRAIRTASMSQVRNGLYTSSTNRWHHYASHIQELANGIREYLDDEDIAWLEQQGIKISSPMMAKLGRLF